MTDANDPLNNYLGQPSTRELLWRRFAEQPELPALYTEEPGSRPGTGRWLSYGELGRLVNRTANALTLAGVLPGMRVGVMLPNSERFVRAWLALIGLNVTMVPVNTGLVGAGLRHILLGARLQVLLVDAPFLPAVMAACGPELEAAVLVEGGEPLAPDEPPSRHQAEAGHTPGSELFTDATGGTRAGTGAGASPPPGKPGGEGRERGTFPRSFDRYLEAAGDAPVSLGPVAPGDLALIVYTSGTTGPSKGVMLSRLAQFWHGMNYWRDFIRLGPGETGYTPLPLFHVSAQGFSLGCLLNGAAVAVDSRFHPFGFWDAIRRHNAKVYNYVGAMVPLLYHRPARPADTDNPVERAVGSATAPELHEAFERRFGLQLIESYGQSETAGLWLTDPPEGRRIGTIGKPRRWLEAAILRPDGSEAVPGEDGEIALRPHHPLLMTHGYWDDPDTTAHAFRDGWYHTGDAGNRDATGYFRFRGRLKDFIRRRGENISAFEIEREALTHPAVREAAAVGVPSPLGEDEVKLCVLLHEGATLDPAGLDRHLRPRLASFMRPRYIEIRSEFPRTPTQRVQKFRLRDEGIPPGVWTRGQLGG